MRAAKGAVHEVKGAVAKGAVHAAKSAREKLHCITLCTIMQGVGIPKLTRLVLLKMPFYQPVLPCVQLRQSLHLVSDSAATTTICIYKSNGRGRSDMVFIEDLQLPEK